CSAFGSLSPSRKAHSPDRRDRLHRQSLASEPPDGLARNRTHLSPDSQAEDESGREAVREISGRIASLRSALRSPWPKTTPVQPRQSRGGGRRRNPARLGVGLRQSRVAARKT